MLSLIKETGLILRSLMMENARVNWRDRSVESQVVRVTAAPLHLATCIIGRSLVHEQVLVRGHKERL